MESEVELEYVEFKKIQLRIIRKYCKRHPELSESDACMKWIETCAKKLREYYEDIQSHSC